VPEILVEDIKIEISVRIVRHSWESFLGLMILSDPNAKQIDLMTASVSGLNF